MENVKIKLINNNDTQTEVEAAGFRFVRERYTPYTQCEGVIIGNYDISLVFCIELYYNNQLLHKGMADSIQRKYQNGRYIITFLSRGYTLLLGQNEPKPGIISDITLGSLIGYNTSIPNVTWEATTKKVGYIFVKEKSTIWDAICAYAYKAYKNYPYIYGVNSVHTSVPESPKRFNYNLQKIVSMGEKLSLSGIISKVYMSNTDGEYEYSAQNNNAQADEIVREKYYPLDKQWYSSPQDGLKSKINYSNRGEYAAWVKYKGHLFENLLDKAVYTTDCNHMLAEKICAVEVVGNKNGVFTTVSIYRDSYS